MALKFPFRKQQVKLKIKNKIMKRKLIITIITLFSATFIVLLVYYCYIQYQLSKEPILTMIDIDWVDSTEIYRMDELVERILPLSDGEYLKKVKRLSMAFICDCPPGTKGYDTFPPIVAELINLEYLDFSWNEISDLTPIQHLKHLKTIILPKNQVTNFDGFKYFMDLAHLDISGNQLSDLKGIEELQSLRSLNLSWNENLSDLKGIEKLQNLQSLNLSWNKNLSDLKGIEKLQNLQSLDLSRINNLSDLKGIEKLTKLEDLTIGGNNFESFPMEILQLKNLKRLSMEDLRFKSFPDSLYLIDLPIEILQMKDIQGFDYIANLPQFHKFKKLRELYLYWDKVSMLNIDFEKCENLETFGCWYYNHKETDTTDLKTYIAKPTSIHYSLFDVESVLARIAKAPKLKQLFLQNNSIRYLPKRLVLPDSLEELNLYGNYIKTLPVKITEYTNLKNVNLYDNPIDTVAIKKIEKEMINTRFYYKKNF